MYQTITFYHSFTRWLVLAALLISIYKSVKGYISKSGFDKIDNAIRHWTATIAHIQLILGIVLYSQSPIAKYFLSNFKIAIRSWDLLFFGLIHALLMFTAIVIVTIGSSLSKRKESDKDKFKTMFIWFSVALLIIFIAIPWPFSPLANRPYLR